MTRSRWPRAAASGAIWAAVYNLAWGVAWLAFMRKEWTEAVGALHQPLPWTAEFWVLWVALTLPFGVALMAYVASRPPSAPATRAAVTASLALWALMTVGMGGWGWQASLPWQLIASDSTVNLVAVLSASLAGAGTQRLIEQTNRGSRHAA